MADSSSYKAPKVGEKHKYSNMINRTTSESIRLSDSDKILNHPTSLIAASGIPRKKTSFQITSVTVGGHPSNDGGDDSADDLDESHAEDISDVIDTSRATDIENETPSYSEDTFSKDDVFFNSSTSLGSAPVIPTSSQYGLAIVSTPDGCTNILNANPSGGNNPSNNDVSDNVINLGIVGSKHLEGDMRDLHSHTGRNERFKVVKIESTEPFKRGRWMCMDFLDHTMSQQHQLQSQGSVITNNDVRAVESSDTGMSVLNANQYAGTDSGISIGMSDHPNTVSTLEDQGHSDHTLNVGSNNNLQDQHNYISHSAPVTCQNSVSPGQTMQYSGQGGNMVQNVMHSSQSQVVQQGQSLTALSSQHSMIGTNQHQSLQPQQMQQVLSASNIHPQQPSLSNNQIPQSNPQIQQQNQQMQQPNQQIQQPNHQLQQPNQQLQQSNQQLQQPNQQLQQPNQQLQQPNQQIQQPNQQLQQPNQQIQQSNQQMQQNNQQMQQPGQQIQQTNQQIQQQTQQLQQPSQQFQQPNQQLQHQGMTMQHVHHQLHQSQPGNILPQQYQQPQMQQIHQQATLQAVQQNTQTMLQAQNSMPQHIQHQHMSMPVQQLNQGQMAMQIPQTVLQNQNTLQQIQQQATQLPVHSQMQGSGQHLQHVQMSMSGVVGQPSQVLPTQTSQPQQYHIHQTSQPMMQPGIQTQPNIMPVQSQYFSNTQITGANMNVQSMPNSVMQSQTQPNPNLNLQQNYSVNTMNQQQAQQIPIGHVIPPPTTIPHMNQPQIPTSGVPVMMTQPGPLPVVNNLSIPSTQNTIISPQGTSQGSAMVQQQYITQPVASLVGSSLASGGLQSYVSSTVNAVPSAVDNLQVYSNEVSTEHTVVTSNQPVEPSGDSSGLEEPQQTEDAESFRGLALALATASSQATSDFDCPLPKIVSSNASSASGASAVAIDNKIEQAMDLVKSHLMFAVREEVEVLKEKIAELMDKINQLEMENAVLKANATQETLAQLSSSLQTPTSNAP